ncbi:LuxR family transcriptional regulator [Pseudonocardia sp. C8]|uniref:ATP-binding protein n=1 Tax=Pseudonocardia sp. C8 TaxID=2762759 RepID=UPI00164312EF|nr:LuxR C-terminal-related transcriptional regulator [Pseudonocardia sp. C8]MBC3190660.1 LuxR family transcriptional regulator [Pseudonocardia sp. C8]
MTATGRPRDAGNLPAELTSFVGRRREMTDVTRLLTEARLVTLTGVGGAGKTRLSLQVAGKIRHDFPEGAWLVELAPLEDDGLLAQTVAQTLGLHDWGARPPASALADHLADKRMLLVLDNCEHLRNACAELAGVVLRSAPQVRILATSRQPLGLTGEHIYQVPTLSRPGSGQVPPVDSLIQYEAVNLFVARAKAVQPDFALTEEDAEPVLKVCDQLDGLPLAIELAAVRLRALSIAEIADRIEDRFRLLTGGSPEALPRHQTLRALIDWSFELCSDEERALWARLSVFSGGFDLAAAEAVGTDDEVDPHALLDALSALVDKSIVIAGEEHGHVRYRMLETIREYGRDRLREAGLAREVGDRHRGHFLQQAVQAAAGWFGPDQENLLLRARQEHGNVRTALDHCLAERGRAESGLEMAAALWFVWLATGLTSEGRRWLERLLDVEKAPSRARNQALWTCAYLCIIQQDVAAAEPLITECQRQASELDDRVALAWATQLSGMAAMSTGSLSTARSRLESGLVRHERCSNPVGVLDATFYLVAVSALLGHASRSAQMCEEALALCDEHGERWLKSYLLWDMGLVAWEHGDGASAAVSARDALQQARVFNEQMVIAFCIETLAWTAHADLKHRRAARLLGCADEIWRHVGAPLFGIRDLIRHHERCLDGVRRTLREESFEAEFRSGARLRLDQAVAFALEEGTGGAVSPAADTPPGGLTPRELEIAGLIADGLSNKAIAAKLVISHRTVEVHVDHIRSKLGFSSRAQVAAWVTEVRAARVMPVART